ncbi:MAG: hypothetical protein KBD53_00470 [Candidatus Omnitrophica bacterium]|nr:hypothetical protein [Candidatus Omnitrophota bacterium]
MKDIIKNLILIAISLLIGIVLFELTLRIIYHEKFGPRPAFYMADEALGWKPSPRLNNTFYGPDFVVHINTDEEGRRLGSLGPVDYTKEVIVLLGDSYTFGWGVNDDETMASYLDEMFYKDSKNQVRVVNLGVGGYGTLQHAVRLAKLLGNHKDIKIKAVIVNHCSNDARDNLKSLGYHSGYTTSRTVKKTRSMLHSINFLTYIKEVYKKRAENKNVIAKPNEKNGFLNDQLWSYQVIAPDYYPLQATINNRVISLEGISEKDIYYDGVSPFTRIQRELYLEGVRMIHQQLADRHIPIIHTFVYGTDKTFISEVSSVVHEAENMGNKSIVLNALPVEDSYDQLIYNKHSGAHYTPGFNKFWAETMMKTIQTYTATNASAAHF